nr:MFS transporter [Glycomyces xiaoerkulensis]
MTNTLDPAPEAERTRWGTILAVGFAQLVVAGGMSGVAVGLPPIRTALGVSEAATAWVLLAYALPMGAVAIAAGRLADRADLRAVAVFSIGGLTVFSAAAALAPNFAALVAARAAQGLLGGLLFGMTGRIVVTCSIETQRGRAMSAITLMMTIGGMGMIALGGFIVAAFDWRGLFWIFAVAGAGAVIALRATVPSNGTGLPRVDRTILIDLATSGGAIFTFLLAFEYLDRAPWIALAALAASVALGAVWVRRPDSAPTVAMLRNPAMAGALLSLTLMSALTGLLNFSLPFLLTDVHGVSPDLVSTVLLAFVGGLAVMTPVSGWLADRFGAGRVSLGGAGLLLAGIVPLLLVDESTSPAGIGVRIAAIGLAFGVFNTPMNTYLLATAPKDQSGTAGAFMATTRTIGTSLGPVLAALAWGLGATAIDGYRLSAWTVAATMLLGAAAMATTKPWRSRTRSGRPLYGDDPKCRFQAEEVIRIPGVERDLVNRSDRRDHQIHLARLRRPALRQHKCRKGAESTRGLTVVRQRFEVSDRGAEFLQTHRALRGRPRHRNALVQFGHSDGGQFGDVGKQIQFDVLKVDVHAGVEHSSRLSLVHRPAPRGRRHRLGSRRRIRRLLCASPRSRPEGASGAAPSVPRRRPSGADCEGAPPPPRYRSA